MRPRLSLVTLGVRHIARARQFYLDGLGWKSAKGSNASVTFIDMGGVILRLWSRASLAEDAKLADEGRGFSGVALAHNVRDRAAVDRTLAEAEKAGATILKPAQE